MKTWSFDIIRQSVWDWWVLVCVLAALVLLCYAGFGRLWRRGPRGFVALGLIAIGVAGTGLVLGVPEFRSVRVGLGWTFAILSLLSATFYLELIDRLGVGKAITLLVVRIIALAMAVPMLFEPVLRYITHRAPDRPLMLLVDTSGSMSFPDVQNGPTRIQSVWQAIEPQLGKINAHFVPRYFTFDTGFKELKDVKALARLQADGRSTDIALGINKTVSQVTSDNTAIALFTDGIDNTSPDVIDAIHASRAPIHTLRVGSSQTESGNLVNIAVAEVEPAEDFVVNHESMVDVTIKSTALPNRVIDVKLAEVDDKGKQTGPLVTQKLVLQPLPDGQKVRLPYTPTAVGVRRIAVWVDPVPGERSIVDNRQEFQGLAIDPRVKVLYIEGRARPEFQALNYRFGHDPNVEWATYLLITKGDRPGAADPAAFRRVIVPENKVETHGTVDGAEFRVLPNSVEGWRKFDVILIGDVPSSFLSRAQQEAIEQAVLNGSALFMFGGANTLGPGGYEGTALERALPVLVGSREMPQEREPFIPRLTAEGSVHPAMQGLAEFFGTDQTPGMKQLNPLKGNVVVSAPKTGAQVLLVHQDRPGPNGKPEIVLAVQRYGKGRSAVFTGDTTNEWRRQMYTAAEASPFNRFWGQVISWLAWTEVRNRQKGAGVEGLLNKNVYQLGENVRVRALVRNEIGEAPGSAQVSLSLKQAGSAQQQTLTLNPVTNHIGMYDLVIPHPGNGEWTAELSARKDAKLLGKQTLKFSIIPPADEMLRLAANPKLLTQIAEVTHGTSHELADFSRLLDKLIADDNVSPDKQTSVNLSNVARAVLTFAGREPSWDRKLDLPMQAGLVFVLLAVEWVLRRIWQLP